MNEEKWKVIKQFYLDNFDIPGDLVDLLSDNDILTMCVSGSSNSSISRILDIDEDSVKNVIVAIFGFDGWVADLSFNPLRVANTKGEYLANNSMTEMIRIYESIQTRLENEWL